jgi:hypothetical protein
MLPTAVCSGSRSADPPASDVPSCQELGHSRLAADDFSPVIEKPTTANLERYCFLSVAIRVFNASRKNEK